MFSICTAFIEDGKIEENLKAYSEAEKKFTEERGVKFRKFFQCKIQPHIIWSITEWVSEKSHNDAAQSIMKKRRDDRFASIAFGPEPYFEIFCYEDEEIKVGDFSDEYNYIIVIHGLIGEKVKDKYLNIRKERFEEYRKNLNWLRIYRNIYNSYEFVACMGFSNEEEFKRVRKQNELFLEEYLFTGLKTPLGMSLIASYNQFICHPIKI